VGLLGCLEALDIESGGCVGLGHAQEQVAAGLAAL
jgi:hypothetical protein